MLALTVRDLMSHEKNCSFSQILPLPDILMDIEYGLNCHGRHTGSDVSNTSAYSIAFCFLFYCLRQRSRGSTVISQSIRLYYDVNKKTDRSQFSPTHVTYRTKR